MNEALQIKILLYILITITGIGLITAVYFWYKEIVIPIREQFNEAEKLKKTEEIDEILEACF